MLVTNDTDKAVKVNKGCVIGQIREWRETKAETRKECFVNYIRQDITERENTLKEQISTSQENRIRVEKCVLENQDIFALSDLELGRTDTVTMEIDTVPDQPPINIRPYKTPLRNREIIETAIEEMLRAGIVTRSRSEWASPVVLVTKKDGTHRFCCDYRALNKITKDIAYPMPNIEEVLGTLSNSVHFTTLDARSGFWSIGMSAEATEKSTFTCHMGTFGWNVMPYGLKGSPGTYMSLMDQVLEGMSAYTIAYMDDILIHTKEDIEDHINHIEKVFDRLRDHNIKLKLSKCKFLRKETKYLGYIICKEGIKPDPEKIAAIANLATPTTVREVRAFVGLLGFNRRFFYGSYSDICSPLIKLTRKYARFEWTQNCQDAFDHLKKSLTMVPMLAFPDLKRPFILYTDASDKSIGACLVQPAYRDEKPILHNVPNERPIYFLSHKLSKRQSKWPIVQKEAYAIYYAVQKLKFYLHNSDFTIKTDHLPLKNFLDKSKDSANSRIQSWMLAIQGYRGKIEFIRGKENCCADMLSRIVYSEEEMCDSQSEGEEEDRQLQV
jgi:hypothetical protein